MTCPHCARRVSEVEYLKEQVRQLRAELDGDWRAPFELKLTSAVRSTAWQTMAAPALLA